jgi:hypothetical protein
MPSFFSTGILLFLLLCYFQDSPTLATAKSPEFCPQLERNFCIQKTGKKLRCFLGVVAYWLRSALRMKSLYFAAFRGYVALAVARDVALKYWKVARCAGMATQCATFTVFFVRGRFQIAG